MSCIQLKSLYKKYIHHNVLEDFSLTVETGETIVILGKSGCGKSVLLKHILGIEKPESGEIIILGTNIWECSKFERRRCLKHVGMLFQGCALFDSMSVWENIAFPMTVRNYQGIQTADASHVTKRVNWALGKVDMVKAANNMPFELSGGMKKRVALARLLVYQPDIILYDEPTSGLDPIASEQVNQLIVNVSKECHATSIVVTHDLKSAMTVGDKIGIHEDGHLVSLTDRADFFKSNNQSVQKFITASTPYLPQTNTGTL